MTEIIRGFKLKPQEGVQTIPLFDLEPGIYLLSTTVPGLQLKFVVL